MRLSFKVELVPYRSAENEWLAISALPMFWESVLIVCFGSKLLKHPGAG
jgi:hypothetical protein